MALAETGRYALQPNKQLRISNNILQAPLLVISTRPQNSLDKIRKNARKHPDDAHPEEDRPQDGYDPGNRLVRGERKDEHAYRGDQRPGHAHQQSGFWRGFSTVFSGFSLVDPGFVRKTYIDVSSR